ncbi:MAG: CotH kinase family protein, partial [Bacteroidales bacterium]|nr:CotH kinase family protein [Bacteroidales bacterium]
LTMFRDGLGAALVEGQADIDHQAYRPVVVYMNGEYWGIFNIREKLNEEYLEGNHGVNPDHLDIIEDSLVVNNGDTNRYTELFGYVENHDLSEEAHYAWVSERIDLDAYINYMGYKIWGGYKQWQVNNKYWKERTPGSRWRWIAFDLEHAFGGPGGEPYDSNTFIAALEQDGGADGWHTMLFRKLMENDDFRAQFLQRLALFMDTFLSDQRVLSVIDSLERTIAPEMPAHILRWESPVSVAAWQQHVSMLKEFAANRNHWMYRHMLEYFSLTDTAAITIQHPEGGRVRICASRMVEEGAATITLFNGLPVRLRAFPDPGFRFTGWGNGSTDEDYLLHIAGDTTVTAMFEADGTFLLPDTVRNTLVIEDASHPWVAGGNIVIPEGDTLVIGAGITVQLSPGASIVNHGSLFVSGTVDNPVLFDAYPLPANNHTPASGQRWGSIIAQGADTTRIMHAVLGNASSGMDLGNYKAAVTALGSGLLLKGVEISGVVYPVYAYGSQVLIDSCRLSSNGTGDLIHIHSCRDAVIRGCDLKGNYYEDTDAIDLDSVTGALVEGNLVYSFFGPNSDGIDLGEHSTGIVIHGNTIKSISDKGISVGQGSEIVAEQNIIVDCNQGFGIKDFHSFAHINQNTLFANRTGIAVFEKNTGNGGGSAQLENSIVAGSLGASVFVDDLSTLTVSYSLSDRDTLQGYNNLYGDPGFTGAASLGFALAEGSVCIDGGTPNQEDPDGTRADIGVFLPA